MPTASPPARSISFVVSGQSGWNVAHQDAAADTATQVNAATISQPNQAPVKKRFRPPCFGFASW